jgi:prepilin-type N-terminal cleavage/methylation domain-containing protein
MSARIARARGFSLLELTVALAVAAVLGGAGVLLMQTSQRSSRSILSDSRSSAGLRRAAETISLDLKQASAANVTIATLGDQNHSVTLRRPVAVSAGAIVWGVLEDELGTDEATRSRAGWSVRYLVAGAAGERTLVRQIVDDLGAVRGERLLLRGVRPGSGANPGFRVTAAGTMWRLELGVDRGGVPEGDAVTFDVSTRN